MARYAALAVLAGAGLLACAGNEVGANAAKRSFDPPVERLVFDFDGREWTPVIQERANRVSREIYVLPGETAEEWTELVTRTLSFGAQRGTKLDALLEVRQKALEEECPLVTWTTLDLSPRSALYEWSRPQCRKLGPQTEIGRYVYGRLGIHIVTYSAKDARVATGLRRQWVESLKNAELELSDSEGARSAPSPEAPQARATESPSSGPGTR